MKPPPFTTACEGFCTDCGTVHSLPVGNSREYALELFHQLETQKCLDFATPSNQQFSTSYLWGDARGQMFGVLECEDANGDTVILKAFSCQYDGEWLIDGWVPPILDPDAFYKLIEEPDKEINKRTNALQELEKSDPEYRRLFDERKALSQQLMKDIHALYHLTNFNGKTRPLTDVFPLRRGSGQASENIPTGVGECCAPKLLNHAALNGLKPIGLSEFYFGKESKSGEKQHGQFYPACTEKCQPILGFMLCGIKKPPTTAAGRGWREATAENEVNGNHTNRHESEPLSHSSEFVQICGQKKHSGIQILHSDLDLVVVNKPSGLLSVPGKGPENQDCVVARVKEMFPDCPEHPEVHRLDMDTSGLMVLARTKEAHRELSRQFHDRETKKRYIALLDGELAEDAGTIRLPFRLDVDNRPRQIYDPVHGKLGITHWKKLGIENGKTRVEFIPITGRTHQLRIHAASEHGLGVPIIGDRLYGSGTEPGQLKLHSSLLAFTHPRTGKKMNFTSEPDF